MKRKQWWTWHKKKNIFYTLFKTSQIIDTYIWIAKFRMLAKRLDHFVDLFIMVNFCNVINKSKINAYEAKLNFKIYHSAFGSTIFILTCLCTLHTSTLIRRPYSVKYALNYLPVAPFSVTFDSILCIIIIFSDFWFHLMY